MYLKNQYYKYLSPDFLIEFENYNDIIENFLLMKYFKFNKKEQQIDISLLDDKNFIKYCKSSYEESTFYPQSFRTSFFIQIFSVLEHELKEICLIHFQNNKKDFSIEDLKGNSEIEKAKLYLKKSAKINISEIEQWDYLDTMRKIRNRFVHGQGDISQKHNDWNKIYNFLKLNKNILF